MAILLNIETATTVCSVSLSENNKLLAYKELNSGYTHAENLTVFIQDVLKEASLAINKIDAVAVSMGPGSYTGLRIGVSTAKGLCYALNKPLIAIDTLQALANNYKMNFQIENQLLCPMIDARRMEVYCAIYNSELKNIEAVRAEIVNENSFKEVLLNNKIVYFGDGAEKCKGVLGNNPNAEIVENIVPSALAMIELTNEKFVKNQFENLAYCEPFYLKEFAGTAKTNL